MRALFLAFFALLSGCGSMLSDGSIVSDFKASADANATMYAAHAITMTAAQLAVANCYARATTDVQYMSCAMHGQAAGFSQAVSGRPSPNRNPSTGAEMLGKVGERVATAAAVASVADSVAGVQSKDPQVVTQPAPLVVRPEIVPAQ